MQEQEATASRNLRRAPSLVEEAVSHWSALERRRRSTQAGDAQAAALIRDRQAKLVEQLPAAHCESLRDVERKLRVWAATAHPEGAGEDDVPAQLALSALADLQRLLSTPG